VVIGIDLNCDVTLRYPLLNIGIGVGFAVHLGAVVTPVCVEVGKYHFIRSLGLAQCGVQVRVPVNA